MLIVIGIAATVLALVALGGLATEITTRGRRNGGHVLWWRWLSGASLDGKLRTDATWKHTSTRTLHQTRVHPWHHLPRWQRAAVRTGTTAGVPALMLAWYRAPRTTAAVAAGLTCAVSLWLAWLLTRRLSEFRQHPWHLRPVHLLLHRRRYVQPLHGALTPVLGAPPVRLKVAGDLSEVVLGLPAAFTGAPKDREEVARAVAAKLAIEAPDADWSKLHGRKPEVKFTASEPPPSFVSWDEISGAVERARADELVIGIGKRRQIVKGSLKGDSPHLLVSMGSGAGKSALVAFWLAQRLRRGAVALILDSKYFSHPWAFKDIDAEYGQLPNVAYARRTEDLHDAMVWLGEEVERRTAVAERAINSQGDLLGADLGPELFIIAEELNLAEARLKQYWAELRDEEAMDDGGGSRVRRRPGPRQSPAFAGLGAVSFAGRALGMHLVVVGQMVTAASAGGGPVRESMGLRCLSRYTKNGWKMQAGDLPMPPNPTAPGRVQCIIGSSVFETQVPYVEKQVRDLVLAGTMTPCPPGMPGIVREHVLATVGKSLVPAGTASSYTGPDQPLVLGPVPTMTLTKALDEGVLRLSKVAAQKAAQRSGFPEPVIKGGPGVASEWKPSDLDKWQKTRDLARRP